MHERVLGNSLGELEVLKAQAAAIQKRINELSTPTSIANLCKKKPYCLPKYVSHDCRYTPSFNEDYADQDAWKCFLALGKMIHAKNGVFVQRGSRYPAAPFYPDETKKYIPNKVADLSKEEARISAEMIDKMVSIYNEYMVKLHTQVVLVDEFGNSRLVPVLKPIEMR